MEEVIASQVRSKTSTNQSSRNLGWEGVRWENAHKTSYNSLRAPTSLHTQEENYNNDIHLGLSLQMDTLRTLLMEKDLSQLNKRVRPGSHAA